MRTRELHRERENRWTIINQDIMKNLTKIYQNPSTIKARGLQNRGLGAPKSRPGGRLVAKKWPTYGGQILQESIKDRC